MKYRIMEDLEFQKFLQKFWKNIRNTSCQFLNKLLIQFYKRNFEENVGVSETLQKNFRVSLEKVWKDFEKDDEEIKEKSLKSFEKILGKFSSNIKD